MIPRILEIILLEVASVQPLAVKAITWVNMENEKSRVLPAVKSKPLAVTGLFRAGCLFISLVQLLLLRHLFFHYLAQQVKGAGDLIIGDAIEDMDPLPA